MIENEGAKAFLGRVGILAAIGRAQLAVSIDQACIHQEFPRKAWITQLPQKSIYLIS
jgi:hypothetical protein